MKIFFRNIHLYLGLIAGLVIMVTCLTGAILVFEKELQQAFFHERYFTSPQQERMALDDIQGGLLKAVPGAKITGIKVYNDARRNVEISFSDPSKKDVRLTAFIDPYNGELKEIYNYRESFFYKVMDLHRWMLAGDTGKLVVGICTLIFLFIILTGIVLWWPRNKQILKQRLKIKTGASFKRLNHDYHIVVGFYSAILLFIFSFTGLAWSFEWFNKGIYTVTGSSIERPEPPKSIAGNSSEVSIESVYRIVSSEVPHAQYYSISIPKKEDDTYSVSLLSNTAPHETASDQYFVDRHSGKIAGSQLFANRNTGQKVRATFKPVHIASIYGIPSKILGLLACLAGFLLPGTGYIMWYNRLRKKRKQQRKNKQLKQPINIAV